MENLQYCLGNEQQITHAGADPGGHRGPLPNRAYSKTSTIIGSKIIINLLYFKAPKPVRLFGDLHKKQCTSILYN